MVKVRNMKSKKLIEEIFGKDNVPHIGSWKIGSLFS